MSKLFTGARVLLAALFLGGGTACAEPQHATAIPLYPDAIPAWALSYIHNNPYHDGLRSAIWQQPVVTVGFHGGSPAVLALIERTANEWIRPVYDRRLGRLVTPFRFDFRDPHRPSEFRQWPSHGGNIPDIRIAFDGNGYWTVPGAYAKREPIFMPTMNFQNFQEELKRFAYFHNEKAWLESREHSVILHEFGHALGKDHEQLHPDCQEEIDFDWMAAEMALPPNRWDRGTTLFNMDAKYVAHIETGRGRAVYNGFDGPVDQRSVMLYNLPAGGLRLRERSPCRIAWPDGFAPHLSDGDRKFFWKNYLRWY